MGHDLDNPADIVRRSYPSVIHACRRSELQMLLSFNNISFGCNMVKDSLLPLALELKASGNMKVPPEGWRPNVVVTEEPHVGNAADLY